MNRTKRKIVRPDNPYTTANVFSRMSFWWIRELFQKGLKGHLEDEDLYKNRKSLDSERTTNLFSRLWDEEKLRKTPRITRVIVRAYGSSFLPLGIIFSIGESLTKSLQPLFLGGLVQYFGAGDKGDRDRAFLYATGIVVCALYPVLSFHPFIYYIFQVGTRIRIGLSGLIYRKCQQIPINAGSDGLRARAINILSNDLGRFDVALCFLHDLWKGPLEALIMMYLMYMQIGVSAVIGVAFMLSFIPLQAWAGKKAAYYRRRTAERTDMRVKLMNEIIHGIQVIKMYAWEKSFAKLIAEVRIKEMRSIRGTSYIHAALSCTNMISPLSVFLSLISYIYMGDAVTAQKVYTVSSYFSMLNDSMVHFWPLAITFVSEALVSAHRCEEFLLDDEEAAARGQDADEKDVNKKGQKRDKKKAKMVKDNKENPLLGPERSAVPLKEREHVENATKKSVVLNGVTATWGSESNFTPAVENVNVEVHEKTLAAVVGPVGAGKSTLLNLILGEIKICKGDVKVHGRISYASQEPWVFEGTIRDNVVFVDDYNERRYKRVLKVCGLERDLELLPRGDLTLVGERGVTLSGGQRARVNLARAVYRKADIYLLDDPLSAVDTHVGKHIFDRCIMDFLSDKICILVTHQLQYLFDVDHLILMNAGRIAAQGSYQELQSSKQFQFLAQTIHDESGIDTGSVNSLMSRSDSEKSMEHMNNGNLLRPDEQPVDDDNKEVQTLGSVKFSVYMSYFKALESSFIFLLIVGLFICARVMLTSVDYFLSRWVIWEEKVAVDRTAGNATVDEESDAVSARRSELIILYSVILGITLLIYIMRTFGFYQMCLRISLKLHDRLFRGITRASMYFFNSNPSGRILNRFSKDIRTVDTDLPRTLLDCLSFVIDVSGVLIIVAVANPWLLVPAVVIVSMLFVLRYLYVSTSRSVKRLEAISRSPIYSLTNQTFQGLTTIRALKAEKDLEMQFHEFQNANTSAWFLFLSGTRAFALWSDVICVMYIAAVTFSFLLLDKEFASGDVGLAILHSSTMIGMCQWGLRQTAELENEMTSVERILEYTEEPSEPPLDTDEKHKPSEGWPEKGRIEFDSLKMRYAPKGELVLKGLNVSIKSAEKIGIVGRTGAGKSSIIQSLFRLAYNEGGIRIDGVDIETLGLHSLRSKISIIPQDPVLFSGTLRYNLDPLDTCSDSEMWKALRDVELHAYVSTLIGGLNCRMYDGGSNFSVGQRQLVCLARAILRNNKILILDEATANVDPETDKLIQKTIRTKFSECTVLTIAHRLHTVMDYDRVMVMDAGQVVEIGHPYDLLRSGEGHLWQLVEYTGQTTANMLLQTAKDSYAQRHAGDAAVDGAKAISTASQIKQAVDLETAKQI